MGFRDEADVGVAVVLDLRGGYFQLTTGSWPAGFLDHVAFSDASIAELIVEIVERMGPFEPAIELRPSVKMVDAAVGALPLMAPHKVGAFDQLAPTRRATQPGVSKRIGSDPVSFDRWASMSLSLRCRSA